ncbi:MAG TPA: acyltransferase family protein, partial [Blastocatellia bacterium]|nr:acyltransferase family protein [Blastocatellia bacterium]
SVLRAVRADRWGWRSYLLARLTRLYVVLLPALLLGGILDWTGMHLPGTGVVYSGQSGMHALAMDVHKTLTLPTLAGNSLFLQTIALPGFHDITLPAFGSNGPLWSLSNEFWYYMAFPLLVLLAARGRSWPTRVACGLGLLLWGWFVGSSIALLGIPWLMGALIVDLPPVPSSRYWVRGLAMLGAFAMFATGLVLSKQHEGALAFDLILGVAVTFLIWVTLHWAKAPLPSAYVRVAQRAARSSYTLYLVHLPLVIFLKASFHIERTVPGWHMFLVAGTILLGAVVYAQLVYQLFERNTDHIRNWIKPHELGRQSA